MGVAHACLGLLCALSYQFQPEVRVNHDPTGLHWHSTGFTNGHSVGLLEGSPCLVWASDFENGRDFHTYFSRSTDRGGSFLPPVRVDVASGSYDAADPCMQVDSSGAVYVAWRGDQSGDDHLHVSRSTDGGASFSHPVRIDSGGGHVPQTPALCLDTDGVLLCVWSAWQDTAARYSNIYLAHSTDRGETFTTAGLVDSTQNLRAAAPSITAGDGAVNIAWRDNRQDTVRDYYHVFHCRSEDSGRTFSRVSQVDVPGAFSGTFPSLATDPNDGAAFCAYKARPEGMHHVFVARSPDRGDTFDWRVRVDSASASDTPNLALSSSGRLFLVWHDSRHGGWGDAYFSFSTDGGISFAPGQAVHQEVAPGVLQPHVVTDEGDTVYAVWSDRRSSDSTPDIYCARGVPVVAGICGDEEWRLRVHPGIATGPLNPVLARLEGRVFDMMGREVTDRKRRLAPGVYFVRSASGIEPPAARLTKVVVTR